MIVITTENLTGHRVREVKGACFGVVGTHAPGRKTFATRALLGESRSVTRSTTACAPCPSTSTDA